MSYIINNDLVYIYLISGIIIITTGCFIKSYFYSTVIETPNSPPTFNFSLDQLKEIEIQSEQETHKKLSLEQSKELEDILDNEGDLNEFVKNIFTEEEYEQYQAELLDADNDFSQNLQDIFDVISQ